MICRMSPGFDTSRLDKCHGANITPQDGHGRRYAYIATADHFPYIIGCYKGTPATTSYTCTGGKVIKIPQVSTTLSVHATSYIKTAQP